MALCGLQRAGADLLRFVHGLGAPQHCNHAGLLSLPAFLKLSGFRPDVDIKIEYSGLRPGEKLYEEKLMAEEGLRRTDNKLIHIGNPIPFDVDEFLEGLKTLRKQHIEIIRVSGERYVSWYPLITRTISRKTVGIAEKN